MKKFYLTVFFTTYHLFAPFVLLNCGSIADTPYVREGETEDSADQALAECQAQEFLTQDCVDLMQAEQEESENSDESIAAAYGDIPEFVDCQSFEAPDPSDNALAETETTLDCDEVVSEIQEGFDACQAFAEEDMSFACEQIVDQVSAASEKCDTGDAEVTTDFCSLLS